MIRRGRGSWSATPKADAISPLQGGAATSCRCHRTLSGLFVARERGIAMSSAEPELFPSVITSSSTLPLGNLFREVVDVHGDVGFDLMILRPEDADHLKLEGDRITDLVADNPDAIQTWLERLFSDYQPKRG